MELSLWEQVASVPAPGRAAPVGRTMPFWSGRTRGETATPVLAGAGRRSALSQRRSIFLLDGSIQARPSLPSFTSWALSLPSRLSSRSITALAGNGGRTPSSLPACQTMVSSRGWQCQLGVAEGGKSRGGGAFRQGKAPWPGDHRGPAQATTGGPSCVTQGFTSSGGL